MHAETEMNTKLPQKGQNEGDTENSSGAKSSVKLGVQAMVKIAMLAALAVVLMLFEIPLPFAPSFYKLDFSEVPVLIGCFAMGPTAGVLVELVKILLNFVITGTSTAGVGELGNFLVGCAFCLPAALIYKHHRTRKNAIIGLAAGTLFMAFIGCFVNAFLLLPAYATAFGMPIDTLVAMGSAVNGMVTNLFTFVVFAVAPFNLVKGVLVSLVVLLIYKKISPILKMR